MNVVNNNVDNNVNNKVNNNVVIKKKGARALGPDDVRLIQRILYKNDDKDLQKFLTKHIDEFNNSLNMMITIIKKNVSSDEDYSDMLQISRVFGLLPNDEKFIRSMTKIWDFRNHILKKNDEFFLNKDYTSLIRKDKYQYILENIVEVFRSTYISLNAEQKESYWNYFIKILYYTTAIIKKVPELKTVL